MLLKIFLLLNVTSLCHSLLVNKFIISNVEETLNQIYINSNNYLMSENDLVLSMKFVHLISKTQRQNYCNNIMPDIIGNFFSQIESYGVNYDNFEFLETEKHVEIYSFFVEFHDDNKEIAYQEVLKIKDCNFEDVKNLEEGISTNLSKKNIELSKTSIILKNKDCLPKSLIKKHYCDFDNGNCYINEQDNGFFVVKYFEIDRKNLKNKLFINETIFFQMFLQNNSKYTILN